MEIGGIMFIFLFGVIFIKFGFCIKFFFGIVVEIVDLDGNFVELD